MKKKIAALLAMAILVVSLVGCSDMEYVADGDAADQAVQMEVQKGLATNQQTPTDIDYSLERYNLIRRAYWVNGQREKANTLICEIEKPLGYIVLLTEGGGVVGSFVVDGKVSSLNSFLSRIANITVWNMAAPTRKKTDGLQMWMVLMERTTTGFSSLPRTENILNGQEFICTQTFRLKWKNLL